MVAFYFNIFKLDSKQFKYGQKIYNDIVCNEKIILYSKKVLLTCENAILLLTRTIILLQLIINNYSILNIKIN